MEESINNTNLYELLSQNTIEGQNNSLEFIEKSMERDQLLIQAIQTGNRALLQEIQNIPGLELNDKYYYGNPIIKGNYLRTRKNGMIIRNTLCRVGAMLGGVPAIHLHLISEKYALQIERAQTPEYLEHVVSPNMFAEYCDLVSNFSTAKYSSLIKDVVLYIGNHLREEINVTLLAEQFHLNASHLARKFKKETGYTVSEYVNKQKIDSAKLLLQGGEISINDIAERLGYNSASYFSRTFKKVVGESPVEYARRAQVQE